VSKWPALARLVGLDLAELVKLSRRPHTAAFGRNQTGRVS
jgi:hypothetical protein